MGDVVVEAYEEGGDGMTDRINHRLNEKIESHIRQWSGTIHGQMVKRMYENGASYEAICEVMQIDYEEYEE